MFNICKLNVFACIWGPEFLVSGSSTCIEANVRYMQANIVPGAPEENPALRFVLPNINIYMNNESPHKHNW